MEADYGWNVHGRLEKNVRFMECPLWRGFVIRDFLGIRPGQNVLSVLREVSALDDVRFREVPLYPLFTTCLLVFKGDEVCNVSNKKRPLDNTPKHIFTDIISLLYFEKSSALSIAKVFPNINFLPYFHYFNSEWGLLYFKYWLPYKLSKKTRHLTPLLNF